MFKKFWAFSQKSETVIPDWINQSDPATHKESAADRKRIQNSGYWEVWFKQKDSWKKIKALSTQNRVKQWPVKMSNSSDFQNASQFEIRLVLLLACSERREEKEEKKKQQARLLDGLLKTASPVSLCYILLFLSYIRLKTFFVLCFFQQEKQINNTPMNFARRCISCNKSG